MSIDRYEFYFSVIIKGSMLVFSWIFAQLQPMAEMGINKAFDIGFSVGLLVLFLVYMIYEKRKIDTELKTKQDIYVGLIQSNTEAMVAFTGVLNNMNSELLRVAQERKEIFKEINKNIKEMNDKLSSKK